MSSPAVDYSKLTKPLCIDLYCGLGGWAEGFLSEGYDVIGFDIERHDYGTGGYPGQLVLQDVTTIDGARFKNADVIVGSSPCQEFSYRAMPWKRAKALPPPYEGIRLFEAQFRIQREASAAAGRKIPMVVENVCGAQKWVKRARWHYGSYYLWGDVPALMPWTQRAVKWGDCKERRFNDRPKGNVAAHREGSKNDGGSWFNVAHNTASGHGQNPDGRKGVPHKPTGHWTNPSENGGVKQGGEWWHDNEGLRRFSSKSSDRKAASAQIAKIPFPLAQWIARCYLPAVEVTL